MDRRKYLFDKYKNNEHSLNEEEELLDLFCAESESSLLKDYIYEAHIDDFEDSQELDSAVNEVYQDLQQEIFKKSNTPVKKLKLTWLTIAASISIIAGLGWFYIVHNVIPQDQIQVHSGPITTGKQGATLTLANGKKINLSSAVSGELAKEAGVEITKSTDGQLVYELKYKGNGPSKVNILSTSRGETYQLRLPDGSLVWLNAASSLTYSAALIENGKRVVSLSGEGYFEIAKDKVHPFVVKTDRQNIEVLGTHFNLSNYPDDISIKTTLLEGSVRVIPNFMAPDGNKLKEIILKPGEQAVLKYQTIDVREASIDEVVAWKNGYFIFDHDNIRAIMKKISRWYDIDVEFVGEVPDVQFVGAVSRYENINQVLNKLQLTKQVQFKVIGRRILIMP